MKKQIVVIYILIMFLFCLSGCYNLRDEFIEPEGYSITYIIQSNGIAYGYVKNEELSAYMNNKVERMTVLYPYKDLKYENQYVVVDVSKIESITIGIYKD